MKKRLEHFFEFKKYKTDWHTELLAGLTTFAAMAYVIIVNPLILDDAGMDNGAVLVATIIVSALASIGMGLFARIPMAIAPGLGVSAFVAFNIVLKYEMTWQTALTACFFSAIILLILNILKIRQKILLAIPPSLLHAVTAGIGLFLMAVALRQIGIISVPKHGLIHIHPIMSKEIILTIFGVILVELLLKKGVKSAFLIVILLNFLIALAAGLTHFSGFVALPPSLKPTLFKLEFHHLLNPIFYKAFFSIFLVTLFDSSAGLISLGSSLYKGGMIPRIQKALTPDSVGSILGSLIGTSSLAIHIESAAGIKAGGRTGITSLVVGCCFIFCLFFHPFVYSVPEFASSPVLIALGLIMVRHLKKIDWKCYSDTIPTVITALTMPIFFSIYYGFAFGFIAYVLTKSIARQWNNIPHVCWIMAVLFLLQLILFH